MADVKLPAGDISTWDEDNAGDEIPQRVGPMEELGVTGVKRVSGYIDEEFLPALRGRKAVRVYREMSCNDSMAGALLFSIDKLLREVEWKVLPPEGGEDAQAAQEFLEECMEDMSHSWDDFIGEVLSMIIYGWSWHEIVYKRRLGPWQKDPKKRSKHNDGKIGWRKMPIRAQETLQRWSFDETGGIRALVQMAPPRYATTVIPIEKSILFRTSIAKGNPEGVSLLRTSYRSWYFKKRLEEFEAIGVERDLAGMPVGKVPADYLTAAKGTPQAKTVEAFKKMVRGVRRDENEGLVLPTQFDPDTKQPLFDFELMSSGGTRQFDTNAIITRYEQRILMSVLADFILVGHQDTGSYSLHTDKTGIFRAALNAICKAIADTLNRYAVPRLFAVNGWKLDELPRFEPTNVDPPALDQLAAFISATAGAGMQWFPDPELEKYIREIARLPEMTDDEVDYKQTMLQQQQAMEYGQGQMELLGLSQKADMTAQGMTPEQAEIHSQTPHPATQEQELQGQAQQMDLQTQQQMQQAQIQQQPPPEDPNAEKDHKREKEKMQLADKTAQSAHGREKEKMRLQDVMSNREHKRKLEALRHQDRSSAHQAKLKLQTQAQTAKKTEAKKTPGKLQKKTPPKKKGSEMPYESKAQAAYMHIHHPDIAADWKAKGHGYVKSKKVHGKLRKVEKVEKNNRGDWAKAIGAGTAAGALANQFPRVQDVERDRRRKKKGKIHKAYAQYVHSDDPEFNHIAAAKTFDLVMKMDDDEAEMFALIAISEIFENDISKNLRTLQGHLNEVIAKRLEAVSGALDRVIAKGDSPEAEAYGSALTEITKAVVNPYIAGLYDFKESDFKRDPHSGQFRAKIKTTQKKPFPNSVADGMGLRPEKGSERNRYSHLKPEERAAYQDQYRQLQAFLNVAAQSGTGDQRIKLRWEDKHGNEFRTDHTGQDPAAANDLLLRRGTNLIGAEANPEGLTLGGSGFALAQAMGAQPGPRTGTYMEGVNVGLDNLNDFNQSWLDANRQAPGVGGRATNQALYNRTAVAGQYLGQIAPNNSKTQAAAKLAEIVGSHGAEAEAVIGPTARKTAYRYRGTEKKPDPHIVDAYNRAIRTAKASGPGLSNIELEAQEKELAVRAPSTGKAPVETASRQGTRIKGVGSGGEVAPAVGQMGSARATAEAALREARPPTWQERSEGRKAIVEQLKTEAHMPNQKYYELQTKAGNTPPSEGVLINAKGQIAAQAVGYGDDHYLPFNLKNLKALKGGEYVRTRSVGGLTSEDIYTGLMAGARRVTVVSRSGTFTVEFEPDFRGGRRYNDKALRMTRRYEQLLDAVQSKQVSRGNVPVEVQDALRAQVLEDYPYEQSRAALKSKYEQRLKEYRADPELGPQDEKMIRYIQNRVAEQHPSRSESEWLRAAKNKVMEGKRVNYQLDAQGYEAAQDALEEQFPYYIKSRPIIEEEQEKISYENDKGYVEPGRVLATALEGGLYGTVTNLDTGENVGNRKYSQSQSNYQRGRIGPGKGDIAPGPREGGLRRYRAGSPAAPAVAPAETEGPEVIETDVEPETPDEGAPTVGFAAGRAAAPAAAPAEETPAAPAAARIGLPGQPGRAVAGGRVAVRPEAANPTPTPATPAEGEPADPAAAAGPATPGTAAQARVDRVRNEQRHEDAAYELFQTLQANVIPGAAVRTSHRDVMDLNEEQFLEAWQANDGGFRDRFNGMVTQLESETEAMRSDPKVRAYRMARNQAVNRIVAGPGLVQHWQREPQHFIGVGYQATDTDAQRNSAVEIVDRRTRPVTATSALSELADVDGGLEREHKILRGIHGELKADPTLSQPEKIDERNQALTRVFEGGTPSDAASRLITTAKPPDLIERMGDVQRMRTLRSQYQGAWPFKGAPRPDATPAPGYEAPRRPDGRPNLRVVGAPEPEQTAEGQALARHTNKNKVLNRVKGLRRYRSGLEIGSTVVTPGDQSLLDAEAMLARFQPGRTPPSDDEVGAFLDATEADYKTNPGALDDLKPGEVQLLVQDPDMFLSQFEMNDDGRWQRQQSETG